MAAVRRRVAMVLLVAFTIATAIVLGEAYWGQADGSEVHSVAVPATTHVASTSPSSLSHARSVAPHTHP